MRQLAVNKYHYWKRGAGNFVFCPAKSAFLMFLLFVSIFCSAATGKDTLFVNAKLNQVSKDKAHFYIIKEKADKHKNEITWIQNIYYMNGHLKSTCPVVQSKSEYSFPKMNGLCKEYFPDGKLKKSTSYNHGKKEGPFIDYYANGNPRLTGKIDEENRIYIYSILDSTGKDQLVNGTGLVCAYDTVYNHLTYFEVVDSLKGNSYYIDSLTNDTVYTALDTRLKMKSANLDLNQTVMISDLPYEKVKKYLGKKLYVICVVDENGKVTKVENRNSIEKEVDILLLKKVKDSSDFNPPTLKSGKKVKVAVLVPLMI